jgi:hypothetical protein
LSSQATVIFYPHGRFTLRNQQHMEWVPQSSSFFFPSAITAHVPPPFSFLSLLSSFGTHEWAVALHRLKSRRRQHSHRGYVGRQRCTRRVPRRWSWVEADPIELQPRRAGEGPVELQPRRPASDRSGPTQAGRSNRIQESAPAIQGVVAFFFIFFKNFVA